MDVRSKCPSGDVLHAFAEGLLDPPDRGDVETHLDGCESCRRRLREIVELSRTLRAHGRDRAPVAVDRPDGGLGASSERCPDDEILAAYADGSLDGRRAAQVEGHLARCAPCLTEVADLTSLAGAAERNAPDRRVERVLARLDQERRTAVVRLAERSVELIRDFARAGLSGVGGGPFDAPAPAFATARSGRAPIRLLWSGDGGLEVECEIRRAARGATLMGRVTAGGAPARATSVTLVTPGETWGPESPDPGGRFGPWPLAAGRNRLVLAGGTEDDGAVELSIEVEADDSRPTGGEDRPGQTRGPSDGR